MEETQCPHCQTAYKSSFMSIVQAMHKKDVEIINLYKSEPQSAGYCTKCGSDLLKGARKRGDKEIEGLQRLIQTGIENILIITIDNPVHWDYEVVDIVSAQSVTGTGVMSELSASMNDMFGTRSNTLSGKLKAGEDYCKSQLRLMALEMDCHAVIGVDIDYSEVGSLRGMMMVCMAGTAVALKNIEILGSERAQTIDDLMGQYERLQYLKSMMT